MALPTSLIHNALSTPRVQHRRSVINPEVDLFLGSEVGLEIRRSSRLSTAAVAGVYKLQSAQHSISVPFPQLYVPADRLPQAQEDPLAGLVFSPLEREQVQAPAGRWSVALISILS